MNAHTQTQAVTLAAPSQAQPNGLLQSRPFEGEASLSESAPPALQTSYSPSPPSQASDLPPLPIQPKLTVGKPDDPYEREADRVAQQVVSTPEPPPPQALQPQTTLKNQGEEDLQRMPIASLQSTSFGPSIQAKCPLCKQEDQEEVLQAKLDQQKAGEAGHASSVNLEQRLGSSQGGGSPLSSEVRNFMEPRFGVDFSDVRVHTGAAAVQMNQDLQAQAFAHQRDIYFGAGKYDPATQSGQQLLAHELTHVVQQTGGVQAKPQGDIQRQGGSPVQAAAIAHTSLIQPDLLDDAAAAVGEIVEGIANWIDLLGPKSDLLSHITDASWLISTVERVEADNDANPKHSMFMTLELYGLAVVVGAEAMGYALRIADCNSRDEVDALRQEFDTWKDERQPTFEEELEAKVEEYREIERGWLDHFAASVISKDPVHPNRSSQSVALTLIGDAVEASVDVETRVNCNFQRTAQAMQDNNGDGNPDVADWTEDEKTHFMDRFQQQLDAVWSTGAGSTAPFRCSAPPDYLLADEALRWSDITAVMQARVTQDASTPHFQLNVFKEATGESNRAGVNTGVGTFYLKNADAGYITSGPNAGQASGAQYTLAHEWHHMIGNPDEYAENSAAQNSGPDVPADVQGRWTRCQQHFQTIINSPTATAAEKQQAQQDLQALQNHAADMDPSTPGFQAGIFPLAGRTDIPDDCFAIRGAWRAGERGHIVLRPGARSQRGGTNISASAEDAARLSDRGNEVRPYMREGIVEELRGMLAGQFDPEVSFDHNFAEMTPQQVTETLRARIQNVLHDIADLGATREPPAGEAPPGDTHDHGDGHDH